MATSTIYKNELRALLNNGTTTTGAVRTLTMKIGNLVKSTLTAEQLAKATALASTLEAICTKSFYSLDIQTTSAITN